MVKKKNKFGCYIFIVCQYDVECKSNLSLNDTFVTPFYGYDDLSDAGILIRLKPLYPLPSTSLTHCKKIRLNSSKFETMTQTLEIIDKN